MKFKILFLSLSTFFAASFFVGCKKFLDKQPDNRTELNTKEKARALLATAYPKASYMKFAEQMSDNARDKGSAVASDLMDETFFKFGDFISDASQQDTPATFWSGCYEAVAAANAVLDVIENFADKSKYNAEKGEALVCRAYAHFMLVTFFSKPYKPGEPNTNPGIPYVFKPEKIVEGDYSRGTVASVYENIEKDLLAGLPLINDDNYAVPKYHFTKKAANAFAAKFFLYKGEYPKSIQHANNVFATDAALIQNMRPWLSKYLTLTVAEFDRNYTKATENANLLLVEASSLWARDYILSKFGFSPPMFGQVFFTAKNPAEVSSNRWVQSSYVYIAGGQTNYFVPKWNEYFYAPDNPSYGLPYVMIPLLSTEDVLFDRAEAKILSGNNDAALQDMNVYISQRLLNYNQSDNITLEKARSYAGVANDKGAMILSLQYLKRIEFIQEGKRWFDILRYDIPVLHEMVDQNDKVILKDTLKAGDPRRQLQIPQTAQVGKITPNPR